jgi:hypothetical protein
MLFEVIQEKRRTHFRLLNQLEHASPGT